MNRQPYELIIGLEVHVQLQTATKLFCRCSTRFGAPPNTQTCPVCIGLPGALPVMNRQAYRLALRTALALNCRIPEFTKWDRKQYYYPDLPKGYQISQYDLPMSADGWLDIPESKDESAARRIRIIRAHLEEDAGKSLHDEVAGRSDSRIDLNRTGTPLLEIVTYPDLRAPQEARVFLSELKLLLTHLGVSDCNMQEGSLRVDANVNLHLHASGEVVATPIVEIKNMNSFRAVERALVYEADRQYQVWQETGQQKGDVPKQTRGWDDQAEVTRGQRHKEESSDYRYFPDPDLVPVVVSRDEVQAVRDELGELPAAIRTRLVQTWGISAYDADVIVNQGPAFVSYYDELARHAGDGKRASNWVQQEVLRILNEEHLTIDKFPVPAAALGELLAIVQAGRLDNTRAKEVLSQMLVGHGSAADAMRDLGIEQVDRSAMVALCRGLLEANPKIVADIKAGKQQAIGALVGQAKKQNANANPAEVRAICLELIDSL